MRTPTTEEIQQAIATLLGGLPPECEMRFDWDSGRQRLMFRSPTGEAEYYAVTQRPDGAQRIVPISTQ